MKKNSWLLGFLCLGLAIITANCDNNTLDPNLDQGELDAMSKEIVAIAASFACTNASDWSFAAIGSKACGGPTGYIAYSNQIDTVAFLAKVEEFTQAQRQYNANNGIFSDCSLVQEPVGLVCEDDKPVLIYNRCELKPDAGPCEAIFIKYYFDQETQQCKVFEWGGCDGTVPFETLEECKNCEAGG